VKSKTVRDQVAEDMETLNVIYASEPETCVICSDLRELRYGVCFGCAATTPWEDPRVQRDRRSGRPAV
jgi:hypothetical protein